MEFLSLAHGKAGNAAQSWLTMNCVIVLALVDRGTKEDDVGEEVVTAEQIGESKASMSD